MEANLVDAAVAAGALAAWFGGYAPALPARIASRTATPAGTAA